jgi:hypothetical protein
MAQLSAEQINTMIIYEVTLQVEPSLASTVERYMRTRHIPEIFATGCFRQIRFDRASPARFRASYQAESQVELDRYVHDHAPKLRAEFQRDFPQGVTMTREVWTQQEVWSGSDR